MYQPVEVGRLRVVDVLALLGHGGRVCTLTLRGLQRVAVALQVNVAQGQRHVIGCGHLGVGLSRLSAALVAFDVFARSGRGGHVRHLDVRDAVLPDDQLRVGLLHLLHVVDGYGSIEGLLREKIAALKMHSFNQQHRAQWLNAIRGVGLLLYLRKFTNLLIIHPSSKSKSRQRFILALWLDNHCVLFFAYQSKP